MSNRCSCGERSGAVGGPRRGTVMLSPWGGGMPGLSPERRGSPKRGSAVRVGDVGPSELLRVAWHGGGQEQRCCLVRCMDS